MNVIVISCCYFIIFLISRSNKDQSTNRVIKCLVLFFKSRSLIVPSPFFCPVNGTPSLFAYANQEHKRVNSFAMFMLTRISSSLLNDKKKKEYILFEKKEWSIPFLLFRIFIKLFYLEHYSALFFCYFYLLKSTHRSQKKKNDVASSTKV
jgi:hypothetical protein